MPTGPKISPALRRQWLEAADAGERLDILARKSGKTQRTVRDHIALARQEREQAAARVSFYRDAYGRHQSDLREALERLRDDALSTRKETSVVSSHRQRLLRDALKSHLRRGGVWERYEKSEAATRAVAQAEGALREWLWTELRRVTGDPTSVDLWLGCLCEVARKAAEDGRTLDLPYERVETKGKWDLFWGGGRYAAGVDTLDMAQELEEANRQLAERLPRSEAVEQLRSALVKAKRAQDELAEQVEIQLLRQVLPGQCTLCP